MKAQRWLSMALVMIMLGSIVLPTQTFAVGGEGNSTSLTNEKNDSVEKSELKDLSGDIKEKANLSVEKAKQYYVENPPNYGEGSTYHGNYWLFSALWGAGQNLRDFPWNGSPWEPTSYWMNGTDEKNSTSNEDAGTIIGSILLEKDPEKFGKRNMVEDLINRQKEDGSFFTIWGESWAMIALDLVDAEYNQDQHIKHILGLQNQETGYFGGSDSTGWMLIALAPHMDRADVKSAVDKAVKGILNGRDKDNGEVSGQMYGENSNSVSPIINGLAAVGEDLFSDKWTMDTTNFGRTNIVERYVDRYQHVDGSFKWKDTDKKGNVMATEQSLLAIADAVAGESTFVRLKKHKKENLDKETTVSFRVEGIENTLYPEKEFNVKSFSEQPTAFNAMDQALKDAGIPYKGGIGYVSSIGGEGEASFGGWDGWQYMVNDVYPDVYMGDYDIKTGDKIVLFYGNVGDIYKGQNVADEVEKLTLKPQMEVADHLYEGEDLKVTVTAKYNVFNKNYEVEKENELTTIQNADVHYDGQVYKTDKNGVATIPGEKAKVGNYELRVTKDIEGSYPRLLRQSKKIIVSETSDPDLTVTGLTDESVTKDDTVKFTVSATNHKNQAIQPLVKLNGTDVKLQKTGEYSLVLTQGENTIEVIAKDSGKETKRSYRITLDAEVTQQNITQSIVISESNNEVPLAKTTMEVFEGDTALDVLKRVTTKYNIPMEANEYDSGAYVTSIAGVKEFDRGAESGWMFRVNGQFSDVGASDIYLIPGDNLEWLYTINFGEDIGATEFVTIRSEMNPTLTVTGLPKDELVRQSEASFSVESKSYFGTKLEPVVKLNEKLVDKQKTGNYDISFKKGENIITITATDQGKRETLKEIKFTYIPENEEIPVTDPILVVAGIKDGGKVESPEINFSVIAKDYKMDLLEPEVVLAGKKITPEKDGTYNASLIEGENKFAITAVDKDGRKASENYTVTYLKNYTKQVDDAIYSASKNILENGVSNEWQAIALERAGYSSQPQFRKYYDTFTENVNQQVIDVSGSGRMLITDVERLSIAAAALGKDAANLDGQNLIEKIYNSEKTKDGSDSLTAQGNNGIIYALIALDTKNFKVPENATWTREKLVNELLDYQRADGAWSLSTSDTKAASFDITGMALTALAPYHEAPKVKAAINKAVEYLSEMQGTTGGYSDKLAGGISSETASQVILGLTANGIDPRETMFTKNGINLLDHLLSFKADDGGFVHINGDKASNSIATEQALQALVSFNWQKDDKGRLFDFTVESELSAPIVVDEDKVVDSDKDAEKDKETGTGTGSGSGTDKDQVVGGGNQNAESIPNGQKLPATATTMFSTLLIGLILLLVGGVVLIRNRKVSKQLAAKES